MLEFGSNHTKRNEHNRFDELLKTADKDKVSVYFLEEEGVEVKGLQLVAN